MISYKQAWEYLDNLQFFKIKLGLESMNKFLGRIGSPHRNTKFIHVGGTNGKGSVAVSLLQVLSNAGYKVGLYTSPHLSSVRERFRINNSFIDQKSFAKHSGRIIDLLQDEQITYFEFTTSLALLWFEEQQVDIAIMEVGLGGRLDATNVIMPLVSIITNVSMDHEAHLGNTVESIAFEKAGIIKSNTPLVSGVRDPQAAHVIEKKAKESQSQLFLLGRDFTIDTSDTGWVYHGIEPTYNRHSGQQLGLKGKYQADNIALALAALDYLSQHGFSVDPKTIEQTLKEVSWPGRLECFEQTCASEQKRTFLLDGAHNPAGIVALQETLQNEISYKKIIMVWASMSDKDISKCIMPMSHMADHIIFCMPEQLRSARPEQLIGCLPEKEHSKCSSIIEVEDALQSACDLAEEDDLILVAGSLYLVGKARSILRGELVADG